MAILQVTLCAVIMVTLATSKPVSLSEDEDSSKSSQSSESNSSEETGTHVGPSQEPLQTAFTETDMPNAMEQTDPPDTVALHPNADSGPSPSSPNNSAVPDPETSTDAFQLMPDDPTQTVLGIDVFQDMPESDPAINIDTVHVLPEAEDSLEPRLTETDIIIGTGATNQPQVITTNTYQGFPQGATPPFPPHIIKPTSPLSTATPMPIPISTALTGVPLCFTFQYVTSEPDPPRGDSI